MFNTRLFKHLVFILILMAGFTNQALAETSKKKYGNLNKGVFLVATDKLKYSSMHKTVIYITQHDQAGTSGFIINRPTEAHVNDAFPDIHASSETNGTVYFGGPLHTQYLFILTQTQFSEGLYPINQNVYFGTGPAMSVRLQSENSHDKIRSFAGFMSWGPEQLEHELDAGEWILAPGNPAELFEADSDTLWTSLYKRWAGSWI